MAEKEQNAEHQSILNEKLSNSRRMNENHIATVCGKEFVIHPGVFSPAIFPAVQLFSLRLVKLIERLKPKRVLDIGAAAGYNGILACLTGAVEHVTCTEITKVAVDNIQENIDKYQLNHCMTAIQSDVFDSLDASVDKRFDLVAWNFPYVVSKIPFNEMDDFERTLFDPGYVLFEKYVRSVDQYLTPNSGRVFIGFSPEAGDYSLLCDIVSKYGRTVEPIIENNLITSADVGQIPIPGVTFVIYELSKKST